MPDDFVMQLHRFERQRLPSQPCQVLPQIQVMPLNSLRISLADYVQLSPFRRDSYSGQPSVIHIATFKVTPAHETAQRRHSAFANTCATTIRVKQPALARFSPDIAPLLVHFRADDDVAAGCYARGYRLRPEFFK